MAMAIFCHSLVDYKVANIVSLSELSGFQFITGEVEISLCLLLQEMIIDKVDEKPVPRYLIYDIIKFEVNLARES